METLCVSCELRTEFRMNPKVVKQSPAGFGTRITALRASNNLAVWRIFSLHSNLSVIAGLTGSNLERSKQGHFSAHPSLKRNVSNFRFLFSSPLRPDSICEAQVPFGCVHILQCLRLRVLKTLLKNPDSVFVGKQNRTHIHWLMQQTIS
jgi:hypothetical protein